MKPIFYLRRILLLISLGVGGLPSSLMAANDQVVAVLSSGSGPYQQAFDGFRQSFGKAVSFTLSEQEPKIPESTRIIVAIGGKAALYPYPSGHLLIYCLTPGTKISPDHYDGKLLIIHTAPALSLTISKLKELQPSLKRLAILWAGDSIQDFIDQKADIARSLDVEIISDRVQSPADLPDHLRALKGKVDALWLPPDAVMVTPANFATIKEFSLGNGIPFYVPSEGLVAQGATASVTASFAEIGALAAKMTREAIDGTLNTDHAYPEAIHLSVNLRAAETCHLTISPDVLKKADKVFP